MTSSGPGTPFTGKTILITGVGGSIGSALSLALTGAAPGLLILLDHAEHALHEIDRKLAAVSGHMVSILGDVLDGALLEEIFSRYHPEIVFHAAAFKHVPLMEKNPLAAVRNNAIATWELAQTARRHGASLLLMVSSDKAVNPRSIMGASKRIAELALLALGTRETRMSAIRLGNVLGSQGSVAPLFREQIQNGGPVTVADAKAQRYFLEMEEAVELILGAANLGEAANIFVPKTTEPVKILDLARQMIKEAKEGAPQEIEIVISGMRPGDKLSEEFLFANEALEPTANGKLFRAQSRSAMPLEESMHALALSVQSRDPGAALEVITKLVPEYTPSETLLALVNSSVA